MTGLSLALTAASLSAEPPSGPREAFLSQLRQSRPAATAFQTGLPAPGGRVGLGRAGMTDVLAAPQVADAKLRLTRALSSLGTDPAMDFLPRAGHRDELGQTHVRFQQVHRGIPVWQGEAVVHVGPDGSNLEPTLALHQGISLDTQPSLKPAEALAVASQALKASGEYSSDPSVELVVFPVTQEVVRATGQPLPDFRPFRELLATQSQVSPEAGVVALKTAYKGLAGLPEAQAFRALVHSGLKPADIEKRVLRYALAWHIHTEQENPGGAAHTDAMVDAQSGVLLASWNSLKAIGNQGWGRSQYSGWVPLSTALTRTGYEMRDMTRGRNGYFNQNVVTNLDNKTRGPGSIYSDYHSDFSNLWGDFLPFGWDPSLWPSYPKHWPGAPLPGMPLTRTDNARTVAADVAFGMAATWDFFGAVFGWNGVDGQGTGIYSRVHYDDGSRYPASGTFPGVDWVFDFHRPPEAYWSDSCMCVTFSDGPWWAHRVYRNDNGHLEPTSPDIVAHELSHGMLSKTARLPHTGEGAGLAEAHGDIMGTLLSFWLYLGKPGEGQARIPDSDPLVDAQGYIVPDSGLFTEAPYQGGAPIYSNAFNWYPYTLGGQTNGWYMPTVDDFTSPSSAAWVPFGMKELTGVVALPGQITSLMPTGSVAFRDLSNPFRDYEGFSGVFWVGVAQLPQPMWFPGIGAFDGHATCEPMNYCFYLMAKGSHWAADLAWDPVNMELMPGYNSDWPGHLLSDGPLPPHNPDCIPIDCPHHYAQLTLPKGMGNDKAGRIWWRAVKYYMTPSTDYAGARSACLKAAKDLYGAWSSEYAHVADCFKAINVR
ncbi:MAG: M4 family metallopeptidase [Acidobacteria bacterium]|nr:M4 family metallopeptidase [Acidobacteriota bacterium]